MTVRCARGAVAAATLLVLSGCAPSDKLVSAAAFGDIATVKSELARGVSANGRNFAGQTPLIAATNMCQVDIVKVLLAAHADPNARETDPHLTMTPLMIAAGYSHDNGCPDVVRALVSAGADVNAHDKSGGTALDEAANEGELEAANILVAAGANVNGGPDGITPLYYAQGVPGDAPVKGKVAIALMLQQHGGHL